MDDTTEGPAPPNFLSNALEAGPSTSHADDDGEKNTYPVVQYNPYVSEDEDLMEYDYDRQVLQRNT